MTIDMMDCEVNRLEEVLAEAGVKTIDQLVERYENELSRLRIALIDIGCAPTVRQAHKLAFKALGFSHEG